MQLNFYCTNVSENKENMQCNIYLTGFVFRFSFFLNLLHSMAELPFGPFESTVMAKFDLFNFYGHGNPALWITCSPSFHLYAKYLNVG
jgi:hypothetical protein